MYKDKIDSLQKHVAQAQKKAEAKKFYCGNVSESESSGIGHVARKKAYLKACNYRLQSLVRVCYNLLYMLA